MDYTTPSAGELAYGETSELKRRVDGIEARLAATEAELHKLVKILQEHFAWVGKNSSPDS